MGTATSGVAFSDDPTAFENADRAGINVSMAVADESAQRLNVAQSRVNSSASSTADKLAKRHNEINTLNANFDASGRLSRAQGGVKSRANSGAGESADKPGAKISTSAVIFEAPGRLTVGRLDVSEPTSSDVVVAVSYSGISTGTERLLWSGRMPQFPGMGYPLVPGYEAVGEVVEAGAESGRKVGEAVFVPGARCYGEVKGLFGAAASRMVVPGARIAAIDPTLGDRGVLLALAATAFHAFAGHPAPDLIVGHGVVGRLIARIAVATGNPPPVVWELNPIRRSGAVGYEVVDPADDSRRDYRVICDASGATDLLDALIQRLAPGGEIVLAGFYEAPLSFSFPPAFMREARLRIAAEWKPADLAATAAMVADGRLSLDGLITHRRPAAHAAEAYPIAFDDPACLKMLLDWSASS